MQLTCHQSQISDKALNLLWYVKQLVSENETKRKSTFRDAHSIANPWFLIEGQYNLDKHTDFSVARVVGNLSALKIIDGISMMFSRHAYLASQQQGYPTHSKPCLLKHSTRVSYKKDTSFLYPDFVEAFKSMNLLSYCNEFFVSLFTDSMQGGVSNHLDNIHGIRMALGLLCTGTA